MIKGTIVKQALVVDYSFQGMGVVKVDNFTIFVPYVKVGDVVDIEITELKKRFGFAKALNYEYQSVQCQYYYECGSCNLMHMNYEQQIKLKEQTLQNLLQKNMIHTNVLEMCKASAQTGYRNKIAMPVHYIDGELKLGYYRRSSHKLIPVENCILAAPYLNELIAPIEKCLNEIGETSYNYRTKHGNIRHVVLRGDEDNVMVTITCNQGKLKDEQQFVETLRNNKRIKSIVINTQKSSSRIILGAENRVVYGDEEINLELTDLKFKVKSNAFFQVNQEMINNILSYIREVVDFKQKSVLDAFCGTGTLGLALAKQASSIVGVEIDKEAISSANNNKRLLGIENARYICDDIENVISKLGDTQFDIMIVDPPRSGLATNMKHAITVMKPKDIVYISCDPSTLIRDIGELVTHYEIESIKGFDMFPNTNHIETVAHLKRREE